MSRRKLLINIGVIITCGIIALSIPVLANQLSHSAHAASQNNTKLVCVAVTNDLFDTTICQLELHRDNKIVQTWDEIYQSIQNNQTILTYDNTTLKLTIHGLVPIKTTAADFHSVVTYQNYCCELKLS